MASLALNLFPFSERTQEEHTAVDVPIIASVPRVIENRQARRHFGFLPFFSKKPSGVIAEYVQHFSSPGELVCDPFAGSGVTAVESLVLGRRAIAGDINPVARFITRTTAMGPIDIPRFRATFRSIEASVRTPIENLNQMSEEDVWRLLVDLDYPKIPIPKSVRRAGADTVADLHTPRQLAALTILRDAIRLVEDPDDRDLLRVALANAAKSANRTYAGRPGERSQFRGNANFLRRFSYSLAGNRVFYEHSVWEVFERAVTGVERAKRETNELIGGRATTDLIVTATSAARIHEVTGDGVVDYVLADPPYGNNINYLDLSTLFAAWLDLEISDEDRRSELLIGGSLRKTRDEFLSQFAAALESISRALKEDRWLTLVYKHHDLSLWGSIVSAAEDSGLRLVNGVWQDLMIRSTRQIESPDINPKGDMYLNFRKMDRRQYHQLYGSVQPRVLPTIPNWVQHSVERIIVTYLGASIDIITAGVLSEALNSSLFAQFHADPGQVLANIGVVLRGKHFAEWAMDEHHPIWMLSNGTTVDPSINPVDRARYLLFDLLRERGEATEGELRTFLLTRWAERRDSIVPTLDLPSLLRNIAVPAGHRRWRLDIVRLFGYRQLRLMFEPSQADWLRSAIEVRSRGAHQSSLLVDWEGIALLRDRLADANEQNTEFAEQVARVLEVLQLLLRRLQMGFGDIVQRVVAVGEWATRGIDLSLLPFEEVEILIVVAAAERPYEMYKQIAKVAFGGLSDPDVFVQFRLATSDEWEHAELHARESGRIDSLGIPLLVRQ